MTRVAGYRLVVGAFTVSLLVTAFLAFAPMVTSVSQSASVAVTDGSGAIPEPEGRAEIRHETLPEAQGWTAVTTVAGPLLVLTAVPLLVTGRRAPILVRGTSTALLLAGVVLGALSFGIFYLPPAALMLVATIVAIGAKTPSGAPSS
jgi:hypothetical protein